jgi:MFS family permease
MQTTQRKPLISPWLWLFLVAMIFANVGGNMYGPLMPLYLKELKASVAQVGLFFTISQIIPLALQILGGWVSDSLGRLRAIAIGSVVGVLVFIPLILANTWQWLLLAEALGAVTRSLVGPSFDAFVAEHSTEENRARVFGLTQAIFMIVSVVGPPLGGWLVGLYGFKFMLAVAGLFYLVGTLIRIGMAREAARGHEAHPQPLSWRSLKDNLGMMFALLTAGGVLTWIFITDGVRDTAFALSMNLFPLYMQQIGGLTYVQIGLTNGIFGLAMMLTTIPAGWLADKKGERVGIALGFVLIASSLLLLVYGAGGGMVVFALGWAIAGVGVGLLTPAYQSLMSKAIPREVRGTGFGLLSTSLGFFSLPAPAIGAQLWERVSPRFPFLITALVAYLSVIPVWLKFKLPEATASRQAAETVVIP